MRKDTVKKTISTAALLVFAGYVLSTVSGLKKKVRTNEDNIINNQLDIDEIKEDASFIQHTQGDLIDLMKNHIEETEEKHKEIVDEIGHLWSHFEDKRKC